MWIEMARSNSEAEANGRFLKTFKTDEFERIGKTLYVGESFEWFTEIHIQNGLTFKQQAGDVVLNHPLGIGVLTSGGWVVGCRIVA